MYTNYSYPTSTMSIPSMRSSSYSLPYNSSSTYSSNNNDRIVGGFVFPFLLGGVTGAAIAPNFWRPPYAGRPYYPPYQPYPPYYPRPF